MENSDKVYSNIINKFSVRILYTHDNLKNPNIGSGVLVKVNNATCYLLTAKHNFKLEDDETFRDVDIKVLKKNLGNIFISNDNTEKVCIINRLLFDNEKYDLFVFGIIDDWSEDIKNLPIIKIDKNLSFRDMKYCFYGYPESKGTPSGILEYEGYDNKKCLKHIFRLNRTKAVNSDALNGFSGSGIFIEKGKNYFLVGIFTVFNDNHDYYYGINLNLILDEINKELQEKKCSIINKKLPLEQVNKELQEIELKDRYLNVSNDYVTYDYYSFFVNDTDGIELPKLPRGKDKNSPVVYISWEDAKKYTSWLSDKKDIRYRLPKVQELEDIIKVNYLHKDTYTHYEWCEDDGYIKDTKVAKKGFDKNDFLKFDNTKSTLSFRIVNPVPKTRERKSLEELKKIILNS